MSFEQVGNNNNSGYLLAASVECADASHWGETSASPSEFSCLLKVSGMRKELGTGRGESDDRVGEIHLYSFLRVFLTVGRPSSSCGGPARKAKYEHCVNPATILGRIFVFIAIRLASSSVSANIECLQGVKKLSIPEAVRNLSLDT
ncbi:Vacuolar membrane protease [Frankliniella fusca]|uniref:Vacuolar membrane protease n=1 Tax=Frankliniella fusca TaxID=407009 RepID=A0AAE1HSC2_9NEOP|nr:Vacuolar membrane protease [Frankliniella fusca]